MKTRTRDLNYLTRTGGVLDEFSCSHNSPMDPRRIDLYVLLMLQYRQLDTSCRLLLWFVRCKNSWENVASNSRAEKSCNLFQMWSRKSKSWGWSKIWYNTTLYLGVNFTLFKFNYCYFLESLVHVPTNRFTLNENQRDDVIYGISRRQYKRQNLQK